MEEELNFFKILQLVTGPGTECMRHIFDTLFPPSTLNATLNLCKNTVIQGLKRKRRITAHDEALLFPSSGTGATSATFNQSLMITLIRNLADITPPIKGWDRLPHFETSMAADIARIKFVRNLLVHTETNVMSNGDFDLYWSMTYDAILRQGGAGLRRKCDDIKQLIIASLTNEIEMQSLKNRLEEVEAMEYRLARDLEYHLTDNREEDVTCTQTVMDMVKDFGILEPSDLEDMMKFGKYRCFWNRIFLVGQFAVGKSTLAKVLVREEIHDTQESTDGIWIYRGRAGMKIDNKEWIYLPKGNANIDIIAGMLLSLKSSYEKGSQSNFSGEDEEEILRKRPLDTLLEQPNTETEDSEETLRTKPLGDRKYLEESMAKSSTMKNIKKLIMDTIREGRYQQGIVPFDIWDFGGQKEFYMTHQLFITSRGVFVLMFNGSKDLMGDVATMLEPFHKNTSEAVYLLRWVNCILTFCSKMENRFPRIIVVATHKDKVDPNKRREQREKLQKALEELFKYHSGLNHLEIKPLIFINAKDPADPEIEELRKRLMDRAMEHPRWGEEMPSAWVPLELMLSELVEEGTNIISREEMKALNKKNQVLVLSDQQLEAFLKVQHSLGKILYFDYSNLRDHIIINPVFLVDVLRSLVTEQLFWPKDDILRNILERLSTKGKILRGDINLLWQQKHFSSFMENADYLVDIMVHLDILVSPVFHKSGPLSKLKCEPNMEDGFIVPCMINNHDDTSYLKDQCTNGTATVMSYMFKGEIIPPALGFRLLASLISMYKIKTFQDQFMFFSDLVVVEIDENHDVVIQMKGNQVVVYLAHSSDVKKIEPTLASSIQECLTASISHISEFYAGLSKTREESVGDKLKTFFPFEIRFGVFCGETICFFPHSEMPDDKYWRCNHGNMHDVRQLSLWFAEKVATQTQHCPEDCKGLGRLELEQYPMDNHLRRLAAYFSPLDCRNIALCLNVPESIWTNLEYQFMFQRQNDPDDMKFKVLHCWKEQNPKGSFSQLAEALRDCNIGEHYLCYVLRDIELPEEYTKDKLDMPPEPYLLQKVRNHIGKRSMQLGIELGLTTSEIEDVRYQFIGKLPSQTEEILRVWESEPSRATNKNLLKALYRIGKAGCLRGVRI